MKANNLLIASLLLIAVVLSACAPAATPQPEQPEGCLGDPAAIVVDLECREIRFAVENAYLPFNYISLETGEPGGWDYEVFDEICRRLNCTPVYVESSWDTMIQSVADGQFDIAGDGITITEARDEIVDFSIGYIQINQRLLVRKGETRFDSIESFTADPGLILGRPPPHICQKTASKGSSRCHLPSRRSSPRMWTPSSLMRWWG